ncbi:hypothetical protein HYH03_003875 [Edaphochlamys debaryana]|uniref:mRNA cap-binding protein n=1 Tax=Edaphochlamys debaryana TaxID=47281 RepID=A0A836C3U3_9CHLO|nr:hypothetical protein HYH03_003875 [Edaphochlamys debaryana]|eukprot:KAG2498117.1 hypothetical protein HYH03_003875 [Edaphochlamys debaryana]
MSEDMDWTLASYVRLTDVSTVEDFWMAHGLVKEHLAENMFFIMREGIYPCWDDPKNMYGRCVSLKVAKGDAHRAWEAICSRVLGETVITRVGVKEVKGVKGVKDVKDVKDVKEAPEAPEAAWESVNGISISPKKYFCIIKIWLKDARFNHPDDFAVPACTVLSPVPQMPHREHHVVAVTPAGRERYLSLLIPQILLYHRMGLVDEYQLWVNTDVQSDIDYMRCKAAEFPDLICLRFLPPSVPYVAARNNETIHCFFRGCVDKDTIYVRFDDDIVLLDSADAFRAFLDYRLDHREYFMVYGTILNNAVVSNVLQRFGRLGRQKGVAGYDCLNVLGWRTGSFAAHMHDQVLARLQEDGALSGFHFDHEWLLLQNERVSINCLAWLGSDFAAACGGVVDTDEELGLSVIMPKRLGRINAIFGGFCCVHYGFFMQRKYLNRHGYEARYRGWVAEHVLTPAGLEAEVPSTLEGDAQGVDGYGDGEEDVVDLGLGPPPKKDRIKGTLMT